MALAKDPVAVAEQQVTRLSQLSLAPSPIKQRHLQLLLEVLNLQADRRLGHVQAVGRFLKAPLADNRSQNPELIKGERQISHRSIAGEGLKI